MRKNKNKLLYDFDHYKNKKIKARIMFFPVLFARIKESAYLYHKYFLLFTIKCKDYGK